MSDALVQDAKLRQEWSTPNDFMAVVNTEFLPDLDVCATSENAKCGWYIGPTGYTPNHETGPKMVANDGLESNWIGLDDFDEVSLGISSVWCNPGFSNIMPWMRKAVEECREGCEVLLLTHASHADWAQYGWQYASECRLLVPRIQFDPPAGVKRSSNARDSFLWVFRRNQMPGKCHISPWVWKKGEAGTEGVSA